MSLSSKMSSASSVLNLCNNAFDPQVVLTKKKDFCLSLMKQFMSGCVHKEYLLVVDGVPSQSMGDEFTVEAPIQRHPTIKFARVVGCDGKESKSATTRFTILDVAKDINMSLLHAFPLTGRTHQIRVHARHCGLPIVGDTLYNPREYVRALFVRTKRHALERNMANLSLQLLTNYMCHFL